MSAPAMNGKQWQLALSSFTIQLLLVSIRIAIVAIKSDTEATPPHFFIV